MTNVWTKSVKQVELWLLSSSIAWTVASGAYSFVGSVANFIPLFINAGSGVFHETGQTANLVWSGSGSGTGDGFMKFNKNPGIDTGLLSLLEDI